MRSARCFTEAATKKFPQDRRETRDQLKHNQNMYVACRNKTYDSKKEKRDAFYFLFAAFLIPRTVGGLSKGYSDCNLRYCVIFCVINFIRIRRKWSFLLK